jgi:hypothetical protein
MPASPRFLALVLFLIAGATGLDVQAQPDPSATTRSADHEAVHRAALDYVEALYHADTSLVVRSVHPELTKYGYARTSEGYRGRPMNYEELKALAKQWNDGHRRVDPDTAVKEVVVFEVLDKTASARITAAWGVDYMHLAKVDGRWMIRNILWQARK